MSLTKRISSYKKMRAMLIICSAVAMCPLSGYGQQPAAPAAKPAAKPAAAPTQPAGAVAKTPADAVKSKAEADAADAEAAQLSKSARDRLFKEEFRKLHEMIGAGKPYTEIVPAMRTALFAEVDSQKKFTPNTEKYLELAFTMPITSAKSRLNQYSEVQKLFFDVVAKLPEYEEKVTAIAKFDYIPDDKVKEGFLYLGVQHYLKALAIVDVKYTPRKTTDPTIPSIEPMRTNFIYQARGRAANGLYFIGKADKATSLLNLTLTQINTTPAPRVDDHYFTNILMIEPYLYAGQPKPALAAIERAEKIGPRISDPKFFLPLINYQKANYFHTIGDYTKSDSFASQAIETSRSGHEPYHQAYGNRTKSQNQKRQKKYKEALVFALDAHKLYPDKGKLGEFLFVYEIASIYVALKDKANWEIYLKKMQSMPNDGPIVFKDLIASNKAYIDGDMAGAKKSLDAAEAVLGKTYPQCIEMRDLGI